jgi:mycofactocin system glycosyltransferase
MAHLDYDASSPVDLEAGATGADNGADTAEPAISVVIPVRDDADGVRATLHCLRNAHGRRPLAKVVVVDDGSSPALEPSSLLGVGPPELVVLRNDRPRGPAAARNHGAAITFSPIVAFIDAGVTFDPTDFARLFRWWPDPVVAVAPRVRSRPDPGVVARYERARSPLDMGSTSSLVGSGRAVPYVPSAFLAVHQAALATAGGFDEGLRFGEDVDFVWRLSDLGWVQYRADVAVSHPPRPTVGRLMRQRFQYGSSAAALSRRHGAAVTPFHLQWSALGALLTLTGRPLAALAVTAATTLRLRARLSSLPDPGPMAAVMASRAWWHQLNGLASALARPWWPLLGLGMLWPPTRRRCTAMAMVAMARRLVDRTDTSSPIIDLPLGVLDDLAYGAGVWAGAIGAGTAVPLLPGRPATGDRDGTTGR